MRELLAAQSAMPAEERASIVKQGGVTTTIQGHAQCPLAVPTAVSDRTLLALPSFTRL